MAVHLVPSELPSGGAAPVPVRTADAIQAAAAPTDTRRPDSPRIQLATLHLPSGLSKGLPQGTDADAVAADGARQEGAERSNYEALLRAHLRPYFVYPDAARSGRLDGMVELHLIVARNGQVLSEWVQASSGHAILDASALDLIHRAQPLPPLPTGKDDALEIDLPLEYSPPQLVLGG